MKLLRDECSVILTDVRGVGVQGGGVVGCSALRTYALRCEGWRVTGGKLGASWGLGRQCAWQGGPY